jgi:hypothetical protein
LNILCHLGMYFFVVKVIIRFVWKLIDHRAKKRDEDMGKQHKRQVVCNSRFAASYVFISVCLYFVQFSLLHRVIMLAWAGRGFITLCSWYSLSMTLCDVFLNFMYDMLKLFRFGGGPVNQRDIYVAVGEFCILGFQWSPMLCVVFLCMELSEEPNEVPDYIKHSMTCIMTCLFMLVTSPLVFIPLFKTSSESNEEDQVLEFMCHHRHAHMVHAFRWVLMLIIISEVMVMVDLIYHLPDHLPFLATTICLYFVDNTTTATAQLHVHFRLRLPAALPR